MHPGNIIPLNNQKTLLAMIIDKKVVVVSVAVIVLLLGFIGFGVGYFCEVAKVKQLENSLNTQKINSKIVEFAKLFIEKVLKAKSEVSFEDRLKLENSVRDLGDENILILWERFTDSQTQDQAQESVKNLLEALVEKISY